MTSYRVHSQTVDSKREEFRKYLENGGVMDVLTRVMIELYEKEDKPEDVLLFFKSRFGALSPDLKEIESLKEELKELKAGIETIKKENEELKEKLGCQ